MKPKRRRKVTQAHLERASRCKNPIVGNKNIDGSFPDWSTEVIDEPTPRGDWKP